MIMDKLVEFCDATALNTGGAASYLIGNVVQRPANYDLGPGGALWLVLQVQTTCTSGGSATAAFSLCTDSGAGIAVDGSQVTHFITAAIPVATLVAGYRICAVRLPSGLNYKKFMGIVQTTAVAAFTAGKIDAFLTDNPSAWKAYDDAI